MQLNTILDKRTQKQLESITTVILSMRGRVIMLGISRWSEGISYKTVERFFDKKIDWLGIKWKMIERVIGEEVTENYGKPHPSLLNPSKISNFSPFII
jgi:hypothetical protein